ncbi:hypothetical protein V865_005720 [Kwoniella europaea PYCC6329]|uniref:Histone deacetylase complex subunit n=1 Tax=Kwoniella europaea PYCC6329 TaxID=1423913 RepID=A0AAX4KNU0_9TREE
MPRSPSPARSRSRSRSYTRSRSRSPIDKIRRSSRTPEEENLSPFLIRIFVTKGKHVPLVEFDEGNIPLRDEFQVYGWKSSTPSSLIRSLIPSFPPPYRSPLARYSFRHIYVDASARGLYRSKDLTSFTGRDLFESNSNTMKNGEDKEKDKMDLDLDEIPQSSSRRKIEEKSLDGYGFVTGDLLSISLYVPEPKLPASSARGNRDRERDGAGAVNGEPKGKGSFGRDKTTPNQPHTKEEDHWQRGQPLPPQDFRGGAGAGLSIRGGRGRGETGGSWRGGPPSGPGLGIRGGAGGGGRRRSPDYEADGDRRRSRSPPSRERRVSWGRRN